MITAICVGAAAIIAIGIVAAESERRNQKKRHERKELYLSMASVGGEGSEFFLKLAGLVK